MIFNVRRLHHHSLSNISFELQDQLAPILRVGDFAQCERIVSARLAALPASLFQIILDLPIATDAEGLAAGFDEFFQQQGARFKIEAVYASDAFRDDRFDDACSVTSLLVDIRFQDLIRRAAAHMRELRFPQLATANDYDFIYEVRRDA